MTDLTEYTDDDLEGLRYSVAFEIERRRVLASAEADVVAIVDAYRIAADADTPEGEYPPWKRPSGAHDAYNIGHTVTHVGKVWDSLRNGNTEEPGTGSWRERTEQGQHPAWAQPLGQHDAYSEGERVTHPHPDDQVLHVWLNTHPGERTNTWEPGVYGWVDEGPVDQ